MSLVVLAGGAGPAGAQAVTDTSTQAPARRDTTDTPTVAKRDQSGWMTGASLGVPGARGEPFPEAFTIGVHWTHVHPHGVPGLDISLGTVPRALVEGIVVVGLRMGIAMPVALAPGLLLLPSGGWSLVAGAGGGGGGGAAGLNVGIAGVLFGVSSTGMRAGMTWHRFAQGGGTIWLLELGVVGLRRGSH